MTLSLHDRVSTRPFEARWHLGVPQFFVTQGEHPVPTGPGRSHEINELTRRVPTRFPMPAALQKRCCRAQIDRSGATVHRLAVAGASVNETNNSYILTTRYSGLHNGSET